MASRTSSLVSDHQYAEDTQMYIAVSRADVSDKVDLLQAGVHSWLHMNGLQINPIKSEVIQFTTFRGRDKVDDVTSVVVSNSIIQPVSSIRSIGGHFRIRPTRDSASTGSIAANPGVAA